MDAASRSHYPPTSVAEQRCRAIVPVTQPLMLCSQIQRSGGTLLTRLFDGHPMCFAHPSELRWAKPKVWPEVNLSSCTDPDALLEEISESWPARFAAQGYHKYTDEYRDQSPRYPFVFDETLQRRIFATAIGNRCQSQRDVLNAYLTALFNAWLDYQNLYRTPKRWVTAFEPRFILKQDGVDKFFADYPDGLLVTLVREPGAWLSSFVRHKPKRGTNSALRHWLNSVDKSVRTHEARPTQVVVLIFEELIHKTEAVMRVLCDRMAIPFSDVLLEPTYNSMPVLSDSSHELVTGLDPRVTGRYQATLSPEQREAVARTATPLYMTIRERFTVTPGA